MVPAVQEHSQGRNGLPIRRLHTHNAAAGKNQPPSQHTISDEAAVAAQWNQGQRALELSRTGSSPADGYRFVILEVHYDNRLFTAGAVDDENMPVRQLPDGGHLHELMAGPSVCRQQLNRRRALPLVNPGERYLARNQNEGGQQHIYG